MEFETKHVLPRFGLPKDGKSSDSTREGSGLVTRALKNQGFWLTLTYVGLIALMARAYA